MSLPAELGPAAPRDEVDGLAEAEAAAVVPSGSDRVSKRELSPEGNVDDDVSTMAMGEEGETWDESDDGSGGMMEVFKRVELVRLDKGY
jgi:hypothetical protein